MATLEIKKLKIDELIPNKDNPNVMEDRKFNDLVRAIEEVGYDQPIKVWFNPELGKYEIVKGNHRYWALKIKGVEEVDCVIGNYKDREEMLKDMVRDNVVKGKLDPIKFTELYDKIATKYGKEVTRQMFGFLEQKEFERLYKEIKKALPEELKEKLEEARKEIKTIDDLSIILNQLFSQYGDTLKYNFMIFSYAKWEELCYVRCERDVWAGVKKLSEIAQKQKIDMNNLLRELFFSKKSIEDLYVGYEQ